MWASRLCVFVCNWGGDVVPWGQFRPSSRVFLLAVPGGGGVGLLLLWVFCVVCVLCLSCFRICSLLPCGRLGADLLALVCGVYCDFVTFPFGILCCLSLLGFDQTTRGDKKVRGKVLLNRIAFIDCNENL